MYLINFLKRLKTSRAGTYQQETTNQEAPSFTDPGQPSLGGIFPSSEISLVAEDENNVPLKTVTQHKELKVASVQFG